MFTQLLEILTQFAHEVGATSALSDHCPSADHAVHQVDQLACHHADQLLLIKPVPDIVHFTKNLYQFGFNVVQPGIVRLL